MWPFRSKQLLIWCIIILLILFFWKTTSVGKTELDAFDASYHIIASDNQILLAGLWRFVPGEFVVPKKVTNHPRMTMVEIPGEMPSDVKFGTYQFEVTSDVYDLSLWIPYVSTAADLYINDTKGWTSGQVGMTLKRSVPLFKSALIEVKVPPETLTTLTLHVSNFHHAHGGIREAFLIGEHDVMHRQRSIRLMEEFLIATLLMGLGLYHMYLYTIRYLERSTFYYGLFTFLMGVRTLMVGEILLTFFSDQLPLWLSLRVEYAIYYTGVLLIVLVCHETFKVFKKKTVQTFKWVAIGMCGSLILPPVYFTALIYLFHMLALTSITMILVAVSKKRNDTDYNIKTWLFSLLIFAVTVVNDILLNIGVIRTVNLSSFGFLFFLLSFAWILSDKYTRSYQDLQKALDELKITQLQLVESQRISGIGELAAGLAHEINNPLGYLKSNIDYYVQSVEALLANDDQLKNMYRETDLNEVFEDISDGVARIEAVVKAVGAFTGAIKHVNPYVTDINEAVKASLNLVVSTQSHYVDVHIHLEASKKIQADQLTFNHVVLHLIKNAMHAHEQSSGVEKHIKIHTQDTKEGIRLTIEDNGIGMDEQTLKQIYEPFFTKFEDQMRKGLGLTSVKQMIVGELGGRIDVESEPGVGTKITIDVDESRDP